MRVAYNVQPTYLIRDLLKALGCQASNLGFEVGREEMRRTHLLKCGCEQISVTACWVN